MNGDDAYKQIIGYGFLILVLYVWSKTRLGGRVIYYALLLMVTFVVLSNYRKVVEILKPVGATDRGATDG